MTRSTVIVVNWNTRDVTLRCLESVVRHTRVPHDLVIVDNGSDDGSVAAFRSLVGENLTLVELPENLGFAGGCNRGLERADTKGPVCLLNSDTTVTPGWLGHLLATQQRTGAALVGPHTNESKGPQRRKPWFGWLPPPFRRTAIVESLSFFCVLISREALERVGPLDERFGPGTFEDDDYCRRAREAGFTLAISARSWVWHEAHATFRANSLDDRAIQEANREVFDKKWRDD